MYAYVLCCCSHRVLPAWGRFLSEIPDTFELVPFGCGKDEGKEGLTSFGEGLTFFPLWLLTGAPK